MPSLQPDPFNLSRKDIEIWPLRLLHVPSMTSVERTEGDFYGTAEKPDYNIMSYTWGRYQVPTGPSLSVRNITWNIPSIDDSHFTVGEFENAIRQVSRGVSFIWLDIACIDQEDQATKMNEIGNQAGIFNKAKDPYIWLNNTSIAKLQDIIDGLTEVGEALSGDLEYKVNFTGNAEDDISLRWSDNDCTSDIEIGAEVYRPPCLQDSVWISKTSQLLVDLLARSMVYISVGSARGFPPTVCSDLVS
jgi:hypothetical protein